MDKFPSQKRAAEFLYPAIEPYDRRSLDTEDGHVLYVEQSGNPQGVPVIVLHGGPGGGCSSAMRRYFDPAWFRIILFDQRGCGKSRPTASVENNTTWHLVDDIERIRIDLGLDQMVVFGGSWGATLSLIYAISHPDCVIQLVLRGVFLGMQRELNWFYGGGAGQFWPEAWARFSQIIPLGEQDDLIAAYNRRLFCGNHEDEVRFARAWSSWENALATVGSNGDGGVPPGEYARTFARLENHYFTNNSFLAEDGWILNNADRISQIPGVIVQGRYDMICPPTSAFALCECWEKGTLQMVPNAGHALSEPGISAALVRHMDSLVG